MTSLSRILKPGELIPADEVFRLPDIPVERPTAQPLPAESEGEAIPQPNTTTEFVGLERARRLESQAQTVYEATIRKAQQEAAEILSKAQAQAKQEADQILELALEEAQRMTKRLTEDARREAAQELSQEIRQTINRASASIEDIGRQYSQFAQQYEQELKWLALEIASKILHKRIGEDDTQLLELVKAAADSVKQSPWLSIQISQEAHGLAAALKQHLAMAEGRRAGQQVDIVPAALPPGSCIIDSPEGIIDASVETQLENLREAFVQAESSL